MLTVLFLKLDVEDVAQVALTCRLFNGICNPILYRDIVILVRGTKYRAKVFRTLKSLASNSRNLLGVRSFSVEGHWVRPDEYKSKARAEGDSVTKSESEFGKVIAAILSGTTELRSFKYALSATISNYNGINQFIC